MTLVVFRVNDFHHGFQVVFYVEEDLFFPTLAQMENLVFVNFDFVINFEWVL